MSMAKRAAVFLVIVLAMPVFHGCKDMFTPHPVRVLSVDDGNTIKVEIDGKEQTVDLRDVEVPRAATETEPGECLGPEAKSHLAYLLPVGSEIRLKNRESDGTAEVEGPRSERINDEMVRSGLGVSPRDLAIGISPDEGLFDKDIACTIPGQIATLEASAAGSFDDRDRSTSAEIAGAIAALSAIRKAAEALGALVASDTRSGPSLVLKSEDASEEYASDLKSLMQRLDMYGAALQKAHDTKARREAEVVARDAAEARRKAEWDAGAPQREAELRAREARNAQELREAMDNARGGSSGGSSGGYTGKRCYSSGGKSYRQC